MTEINCKEKWVTGNRGSIPRGSMRNCYHIQGMLYTRKLPTPDTGR